MTAIHTWARGVLSVMTLVAAVSGGAAAEGVDGAAAMATCRQSDSRTGSERLRVLEVSLQMAEAAIARNPRDPQAHFAVFCSLGKHMQERGGDITDLATVRRMRRELDIGLQLAPNDAELIAAKGIFLIELPRLLGGNSREGEQLLRHALSLDPDNQRARSQLAESLLARGEVTEARAVRDFLGSTHTAASN